MSWRCRTATRRRWPAEPAGSRRPWRSGRRRRRSTSAPSCMPSWPLTMIQSPARTTGVYGPRGLLMCASYARLPSSTSTTPTLPHDVADVAAPPPRRRRRSRWSSRLRRRFVVRSPAIAEPRPGHDRVHDRPAVSRATRSCPARSGCRSRSPTRTACSDDGVPQCVNGRVLDGNDKEIATVSAPIHSTDLVIPYWADQRADRPAGHRTRCASTATTGSAPRSRSPTRHRSPCRTSARRCRRSTRRPSTTTAASSRTAR